MIHNNIIKDRIETLLPLKSFAADLDVANIEIVADAAMSVLELYNFEHLECVVPTITNEASCKPRLLTLMKKPRQREMDVHRRAVSCIH